jgi:hypothetical protein
VRVRAFEWWRPDGARRWRRLNGGGPDGGPARRRARSPEAERVTAERLRVGALMVVLEAVKTSEQLPR